MTTEEWWSLFLGCLAGTAILVCSFAARTMWRRGSARAAARRYPPPMLCPVCLARHYPRCPTEWERLVREEMPEMIRRYEEAVSGWSPPCVTPAGSAGPTAPTTTPETGGSPNPGSAGGADPDEFAAVIDDLRASYRPGVPHDQVPIVLGPDLPDDDEPCIGLCEGCPADCPLLGDLRIHHNPGSGRRGQFGMCDYP